MDEDRHTKRSKREIAAQAVEDRLSSLPDAILIDILSRLEIHKAGATSILSRRWRHLWTAVTRFEFSDTANNDHGSNPNISSNCFDILQKLTSPKLYIFDYTALMTAAPCVFDVVRLCFLQLRLRQVKQISIKTTEYIYSGVPYLLYFCIPTDLFQNQFLVTLELCGRIQLPCVDPAAGILLPNLKKLRMVGRIHVYSWLGTLFSSCPLLEDLHLNVGTFAHPRRSDLQICAPNLKSLHIENHLPRQTPWPKISIDAPMLKSLTIIDPVSWYFLVQEPLGLNKAFVDFDNESDYVLVPQDEDYRHQMSKFVAGLSSVCELRLSLLLVQLTQNNTDTDNNIAKSPPETITYPNLASFQTAADGMGLNGWKDLLFSLQSFPNLNHLKVCTESFSLFPSYSRLSCRITFYTELFGR